MTQGLDRLLWPRSIAVIGGGAWCGYVVENCRKIGFADPVWPVHPTRDSIGGVPAFKALADLPGIPDAAFVGVNREATVGLVAELSAMGAGGAVAYASGFREAAAETADAHGLQDRLLQAARGMTLIGPNCYGFVNYLDGAALWPDQQGGARVDNGVAIITQSSNIAINLTMQRRGLPLAYVVTAGNQAQTGLAQIGAALLADTRVTALGMHVEGVGDIRAMERLAQTARSLGKPVIVLKAGRSEAARAATISHTASLAGSSAGSDALFDRLGIARVGSLTILLETLKLLHVAGPLASNRIASMSCSGGEASLMADTAMDCDVEFPPLNDGQRNRLRAALGPRVALANPLDYHTYIWADTAAMTATYSGMMDPSLALGAVVADFPREDRCTARDWEPVIAALSATRAAAGVPMALVASLPDTLPEAAADRLIGLGIAPLAGFGDALQAIAATAWLGRDHGAKAPVLLPRPVAAPPRLLSEAEGKAALAVFGIDIPAACHCEDRVELEEAALEMSYPLVLKGEGVAHKTEAGAVVLGLTGRAEVLRAAAEMPATSWLLEEMIAGGVAEVLVGVVMDPAHGYVLTLAAGGTLTELLQDSASLLLPVDAVAVRAALDRLRIAPVLAGYRGAAAADTEAIVRAVLALQAYVIAYYGRVEEVEINPLICTPGRAVAADVLIRIGDENDG